ncbi:hypothetical protein D9M70_582800 [compost metagenome]
MRKVTMVVPVFITSCQLSEYPETGPVRAHAATTPTARPNAIEDPAHAVTAAAK